MESRFILNIDSQMESTIDPNGKARLNLEKASYLARRGDLSESEEIVVGIRGERTHLLDVVVGAWINFAEGMQFHCIGNDVEAKVKWSRCTALARSVGASQVLALASSWLAFIDYTNLNIRSLVSNMRAAITNMDRGSHETSARASLTAAQIFHVCGDTERARVFYDRCRLACLDYGDDVMLAALIHNMAWLRMATQRNERLQGLAISDDNYFIEAAAESTKSYEALIGSKGLDVMTPLLGAQVDIIFSRYADAVQVISERLEDLRAQGLFRLRPTLIADRAYCRAELGDLEGARVDVEMAIQTVSTEVHIDDLAVLYARIARVYELANDSERSNMFGEKAAALWHDFRSLQRSIILEVEGMPGFGA